MHNELWDGSCRNGPRGLTKLPCIFVHGYCKREWIHSVETALDGNHTDLYKGDSRAGILIACDCFTFHHALDFL